MINVAAPLHKVFIDKCTWKVKKVNKFGMLWNEKYVTDSKGAGSRNVNKLLSKRRFRSIFDRPYYNDCPLSFSK